MKKFKISKSTKPLIKIKIIKLKLCLVNIQNYNFLAGINKMRA